MTKQQAINVMEKYTATDIGIGKVVIEAHKMAVAALEKQIKKSIKDDGAFGACPNCNREFNSELLNEYELAYCLSCGQRLDRYIG